MAPADGGVLVRDSKHPDGAPIAFDRGGWAEFLEAIRAGEYDRL